MAHLVTGCFLLLFMLLALYQIKTGSRMVEKILDVAFPVIYIAVCLLMIVAGIVEVSHAN